MECLICRQQWDLLDRRPKGLPCQHSVCASCLGRLDDHRCPHCRQDFEEPVVDNFALVACLEALQLKGPHGLWWCLDCRSAASPCCVGGHAVRRPRAALEKRLLDLVPRAVDGLQEDAALAALRLVSLPAVCKMSLQPDDGDAVCAEWRVPGQGHGEDALLEALVVAAAASGGMLQQESTEDESSDADNEESSDGGQFSEGAESSESGDLWESSESSEGGDTSAEDQVVSAEWQEEAAEGQQEQASTGAQEPPSAAQLSHQEEIDLNDLSETNAGERQPEKERALQRVRDRGVRDLILNGNWDPDWVVELLRSAAQTLETLRLWNPNEAQVVLANAMPRLHHLELSQESDFESVLPPELPAPPRPSSVRFIRITDLPRTTTQCLLKAHAASLETVELTLGADRTSEWPIGCSDLDELLSPCGLHISELQLERYDCGAQHDHSGCSAQKAAVRRVLPECHVYCQDYECCSDELQGP